MPADGRSVLFSVAHSALTGGASPPQDGTITPFTEYDVSLRASLAAFRTLAGRAQVEIFDCGAASSDREYARLKTARVNQCKPTLAIEIHCNSAADPRPNYSEVIYYAGSVTGRAAAQFVANSLRAGFLSEGIQAPVHGARANTIQQDGKSFFFLEDTLGASIIVEGVFISNHEHARWLSRGGAEMYGTFVAEGILEWLGLK